MAELQPGLVIADRYELVEPLGRGGSGTTYRGVDRTSGIEVAVKRLELGRARDWKRVELFEREGQTLAQLAHPSIPRYRDAFALEGELYLVQSLVKGTSLARLVDERGPLDEREVVRIGRELLSILAYLHERPTPVIHRDIKPANVMVEGNGRIHLVDFGAARDRSGEQTGTTVVGTYGYVAPEQFRGSATPASDIYGVAATMLFLLYGRSPDELPQQRLRVQLPRERRVSPALAAFLTRALEPAPEDRFPSARAALDALDAKARPPRRVLALAGVLVLVASAAAAFVALNERRRAAPVAPARVDVSPWAPRLELARYPELRVARRVPAHTSALFDVASSPDGAHVATASYDGTAKIWTTGDWKLVTTIGHTGRVGGVRFADDATVITGGDTSVRVFDFQASKELRRLAVGTQVTSVDLAKGVIIASSFDGNVRSWSLATGEPGRTFAHSPGKGRVFTARFSPDGGTLATAGDDRAIRLWNAANGAVVRTLSAHEGGVTGVAFSADGTLLASTSDDKTVRIFATADGTLVTTIRLAADYTSGVAFGPTGAHLAMGARDKRLRVLAVPQFTQLFDTPDASQPLAIHFADASTVLVGSDDGALHVAKLPGAASRTLPVAKVATLPPIPETPREQALAERAARMIRRWGGKHAALDAAERLAKESLAIRADYPPALVQLARIVYRRGMRSSSDYAPEALAAARKILDGALARDPKLFIAHEALAWVYLQEHKDDDARASVAAARELESDAIGVRFLEAELSVREQAWDLAERLLREIIESGRAYDIDLVVAYAELVNVYIGLGDLNAADAAHRRILELDPASAWSHGNYAGFLLNRGQYGRAMEMAKRALQLSDYPGAHMILSAALVGVGIEALWDRHDVDGAKGFFEAAAHEDARSALAHYGLAAVHRAIAVQRRDRSAALASREELRLALKLDKNFRWATLALTEQEKVERAAQ